jgi:hypothetical protein
MALENAKNSLLRAERARTSLGGRPQAQQITRSRTEPSWGIFGWMGFTKQVNYIDYDESNVLKWKQNIRKPSERLQIKKLF